MNGKKAKDLRRIARELTRGRPRVAYQALKPRTIFAAPVPIPGTPTALFLGHVEMIEDCTRRVYQQLKNPAKRQDVVHRAAYRAVMRQAA
jgi:hypothetical protein